MTPRRAGGGEGSPFIAAIAVVLVFVAQTVVASDVKIYGLTLVKCHCQAGEVVTEDGSCLEQPGGTTVILETGQVDTSSVSVEVRPLECPHTEVTLVQGDVHLRHRGDWVVLRGPWRGLRVNHYCLQHYLTSQAFLTWRLKICIPPPTIPRCCPEGQVMKGDKCTNSTLTLGAFNPPLLAGPGELPIKWPGKTVELNPLASCKRGSRAMQVMLGRQAERRASVIALPTGLVLVTTRGIARAEYTFAPDFCIDAGANHQPGNADNASYFGFYCDSIRASDLRCNDTNVCVRKCCGEGQSMHAHIGACVPTKQAFIAPFEEEHPVEVHVLVGLPSCAPIGHVALDKGVDQRGGINQHGRRYNSSEYCLDNFIRGNTSSVEVLVCITQTEKSGWVAVRLYITPILLAVSAASAVVLLIMMWLLPELRRDGGQAQASHAVAILIATLTLLILQIPNHFSKSACIVMALLLHFSFMAMFTWVAVMSLVLWMRVRTIAGSGGGPPINQTLVQQCAGWGIPLIVILLNTIIHFTVPQDQTGVVHPRIAEGRCWYAGTIEVVLYFYLPILVLVVTSAIATGVSLWHYCTMSRESISMSGLGEQEHTGNGTATDVTSNGVTNIETATQETQHSFDYKHEILQHSILVGFATFFWITEGLSMEIKPIDIWSLADIINSLYGLVALLIFYLNPNKRRHIQVQNLRSSFLIKTAKLSKLRSLFVK